MESGANPLDVSTFEEIIANVKPIILDVRKPDEFAAGHIPGSLYIGLDGQFAPWVGTVITDLNFPLLIIAPVGREEETVMRLSRVGYDNCIGYLKGGFDSWKNSGKQIGTFENITADQYVDLYKKGIDTLDVRKTGEYNSNYLQGTINKPLDFIFDWIPEMDKDKKFYVNCAGGYRSMIAVSILRANGYKNLVNVAGGFGAIAKTGIDTCKTACSN
jgi:rhodanese-related sulfurtransferase